MVVATTKLPTKKKKNVKKKVYTIIFILLRFNLQVALGLRMGI